MYYDSIMSHSFSRLVQFSLFRVRFHSKEFREWVLTILGQSYLDFESKLLYFTTWKIKSFMIRFYIVNLLLDNKNDSFLDKNTKQSMKLTMNRIRRLKRRRIDNEKHVGRRLTYSWLRPCWVRWIRWIRANLPVDIAEPLFSV